LWKIGKLINIIRKLTIDNLTVDKNPSLIIFPGCQLPAFNLNILNTFLNFQRINPKSYGIPAEYFF
jgi:hypothetical protein